MNIKIERKTLLYIGRKDEREDKQNRCVRLVVSVYIYIIEQNRCVRLVVSIYNSS